MPISISAELLLVSISIILWKVLSTDKEMRDLSMDPPSSFEIC